MLDGVALRRTEWLACYSARVGIEQHSARVGIQQHSSNVARGVFLGKEIKHYIKSAP